MDRSDKRNGFSLLGLLIVVAIILIIASIAVPNLLRSRQSANEAGAVSTLRAVNGAQTTYLSTNGVFGSFAQLSADGMIDARFSANGALVGGYTYSVYGGGTNDYRVSAIVSGTQGRYNYYTGPTTSCAIEMPPLGKPCLPASAPGILLDRKGPDFRNPIPSSRPTRTRKNSPKPRPCILV